MKHYSQAAVERTMKVQEVIMRAMARKITWYEAAEIAKVSHELRTPLTAILGWARLLRKSAVDESSLHALEIIERNAVKQAQVIEDLLDLSRCLAGELRLKRSATGLAPLIKNSVDSLQQTSQAKRQTLKLDVTVDGVSVYGDAARLEQVVSNLVSNAIK